MLVSVTERGLTTPVESLIQVKGDNQFRLDPDVFNELKANYEDRIFVASNEVITFVISQKTKALLNAFMVKDGQINFSEPLGFNLVNYLEVARQENPKAVNADISYLLRDCHIAQGLTHPVFELYENEAKEYFDQNAERLQTLDSAEIVNIMNTGSSFEIMDKLMKYTGVLVPQFLSYVVLRLV